MPRQSPSLRSLSKLVVRLLLSVVVSLGLTVAAGAASAAPGLKIAVVDVQKVVNAAEEWKKALADLEKTLKMMQAGIESKKGALAEKRQKLEAKKAVSDAKAIAAEDQALTEEEQRLVQEFVESQQRLSMAESRLKSAMFERVQQVVGAEGQKADFDYVLDTGDEGSPNVLYNVAKIDLTDRIIKAYADTFKGKPLNVKLADLLPQATAAASVATPAATATH